MPNRVLDLTGQRFGRLTVLNIAHRERDAQGGCSHILVV